MIFLQKQISEFILVQLKVFLILHFHISENDRGAPGSGHIPWNEVKAGLKSISYNNWIVAEMFVSSGNPASSDLNIWRDIEQNQTKAAEEALNFMRKSF